MANVTRLLIVFQFLLGSNCIPHGYDRVQSRVVGPLHLTTDVTDDVSTASSTTEPVTPPSWDGPWSSRFETIVVVIVFLVILFVALRDLCRCANRRPWYLACCATLCPSQCAAESEDDDVESNQSYAADTVSSVSLGDFAEDPPCYTEALHMPKPSHDHVDEQREMAVLPPTTDGHENPAFEGDTVSLPGYEDAVVMIEESPPPAYMPPVPPPRPRRVRVLEDVPEEDLDHLSEAPSEADVASAISESTSESRLHSADSDSISLSSHSTCSGAASISVTFGDRDSVHSTASSLSSPVEGEYV